MIEFVVITCDTNHREYRGSKVLANDIDQAAETAIRAQHNRFVVAVIEADHYEAILAESEKF